MIIDHKLDFVGISETIKQDFTKMNDIIFVGAKITNGVGIPLEGCLGES